MMKICHKLILAALLAAGLGNQALAVQAAPVPTVVFEFETSGFGSNDTIATAQNLGSLMLGDNMNVYGSRLTSLPGGTSVDYYKFSTSTNLDLSFAVNTMTGIIYQNDPMVGLFSNTGVLISANDDRDSSYDSLLTATLSAGTYYVAVSGFSNFDFTGNGGNGNWLYNLNITTGTPSVVVAAPVPEPETYAMFLAGLGLIGTIARRRKKSV